MHFTNDHSGLHKSALIYRQMIGHTRNLQGLQNNQNAFYFVNQQYPDEYEAEPQEMVYKMKIKEKNESLPPEQKTKVSIKGLNTAD